MVHITVELPKHLADAVHGYTLRTVLNTIGKDTNAVGFVKALQEIVTPTENGPALPAQHVYFTSVAESSDTDEGNEGVVPVRISFRVFQYAAKIPIGSFSSVTVSSYDPKEFVLNVIDTIQRDYFQRVGKDLPADLERGLLYELTEKVVPCNAREHEFSFVFPASHTDGINQFIVFFKEAPNEDIKDKVTSIFNRYSIPIKLITLLSSEVC